MAEVPADDRTEQPTPQRRREAREKGQVARSMDLNNAVVLTLGVVLLSYVGRDVMESMTAALREFLGGITGREITVDLVCKLFVTTVSSVVTPLTPFLFGLMVAGAGIGYMQAGGLVISLQAITPKFDKVNPINGAGRLFSVASLARLGTTLAKLVVIGLTSYYVIYAQIRDSSFLQCEGVLSALIEAARMVYVLAIQIGVVLAIIAILDYGYQRWQHEKNLRMTKQEVKEEMKRYEGDPHMKARIRQVQREMAKLRMMEDVKTADVVVTNPTHFAVALKYDKFTMNAPKVVAKGVDLMAKRIKEIAAEHHVPQVENRPLARALYKAVDIGQEVPPKFYQAVAEVLAYLYRLRHPTPTPA